MSIGTGIVLFVIGAILVFAVNIDTGGFIELPVVGYILMGAGLVVLIIGLVMLTRRRQAVTTSRTGTDSVSGERVQQRVTEVDDPTTRL